MLPTTITTTFKPMAWFAGFDHDVTCITTFGPQRSMFESNFPVDKGTCSYQVLWNAFKRIAAGYSTDEKTALFNGAAPKAYRLAV